MADVSDPAIVDAYNQVRKDDSGVNWLLLGYEGNKKIVLSGSGGGGISELVSQLQDDQCNFGYLRVVNSHEETSRTKFVFISWKGENSPVMRKGNMSVHVSNVKKVIRDYAIEISATEKSELTEEEIMAKLKKANY